MAPSRRFRARSPEISRAAGALTFRRALPIERRPGRSFQHTDSTIRKVHDHGQYPLIDHACRQVQYRIAEEDRAMASPEGRDGRWQTAAAEEACKHDIPMRGVDNVGEILRRITGCQRAV